MVYLETIPRMAAKGLRQLSQQESSCLTLGNVTEGTKAIAGRVKIPVIPTHEVPELRSLPAYTPIRKITAKALAFS